MLGREVEVAWPPRRIVSVVPSQTELLAELGLEKEVVGITKFCVHPESWFRTKTQVGGTKQLHLDRILQLEPDVVIANKEENVREQIEALAGKVPVWVSHVEDITGALHMVRQVGALVGKTMLAEGIASRIEQAIARWQPPNRLRAAYFIWRRPWMVAGGDTFIHHMMALAGFDNVFADRLRYPEIDAETLRATAPAVLLLSSEPYPFKPSHAEELLGACPGSRALFVDGEMFSWYGSRMLHAIPYFESLWEGLETG